jgi:MFS family permease
VSDHDVSVSPRLGFWMVAYVFTAAMLGNTLPTPLYVIYQARFHFSSGMVTLIFATYAAGVLVALLLAGRASDQVGRRPILAAALGFSVFSTLAFIFASSTGWLFAGRALSGLSAGLITGTGTATLTELAGAGGVRRASIVATAATTGGLGLGPLVAGFFAEYAPNPTVLVFQIYLGLLALGFMCVAVTPETVRNRRHLQLRFVGFRIPQAHRREFLAAGAAGFAALALLGLFTALAPSFLGGVMDVRNHALGGFLVFLMFAASTLAQIAFGRSPSEWSMRIGLGVFIVALALIVAALDRESMALFVAGTIVGGGAVGAAFIGSLSTANRLAPAEVRAQIVSTYFTIAYVGLIIPVITVGYTAEHIGYLAAVFACAIGLALVCAATIIFSGRARPAPAPIH